MDNLTSESKTLPDASGSQQELFKNRINNVPEIENVNADHIKINSAKADSFSDGYLLTTTSEPNLKNGFTGHSSEVPNSLSLKLDSQHYNPLDIDPTYDNQYQNSRFLIDDHSNMYGNEYFDKNINLFDLTPDQQLAIRELELRRQQAEYDDDYDFALNYEQILDYDVREKLESLNAQLANEPSPPEPEHRNSKVVFKDELVSLVAPAAEYELSESDFEEPNDRNVVSGYGSLESNNGTNYLSPVLLSDGDYTPEPYPEKNEETSLYEATSPQSVEEKNIYDKESRNQLIEDKYSEDDNHNIVVSRGGEFQLMGRDDMIYSSEHVESSNSNSLEREDEKLPKLRPISAPATKRNRNEVWSNSQLDSSNSSVKSELNYRTKPTGRSNSKMDVPRVDRDLLQRQKEREENRKKEQREREELESKNRREMNEKCFNAWLQSKNKALKEELDRKKKEEEEERKEKEKIQEERKMNAQEKEKLLAKSFEQQKRREEKLRQYRIKEMEESIVVHTDNECKKAFKEWMKKKKQSHQLKVKEEKQKARITRLAMRQCRKSQNLAQAIHQANSFRYLDFYGYP